MPSYIGYRPQFNPISLQEYLAVPTMIQQEFDTYEDKYNENLDKLAVLEGMTDESTRYLTDRYRDKLSNAADVIAGKSGSLSDLRSQIDNARQYYRETAPRLTNAYTRRQDDLKAAREIQLKDPSAIVTPIGNMQSYIDSDTQQLYTLSGDKIYNDMLKAGQLAAADITKNSIGKSGVTGYLNQIVKTGYTLDEQRVYADLVQRAFNGDQAADEMLKNTDIYAQPYQALQKYVEDNKFNKFDNTQQSYALNKALTGQLLGMRGTEDSKLLVDQAWKENRADARAATRKGTGTTPKSWTELYESKKGTQPNVFGTPVSQIGRFNQDVQVGKKRGNVITQTDGKTSLKNRKGILEAIHLDDLNITDKDYDYFINNDGFISLEDLRNRSNTIGQEVAKLYQSGGHGAKDSNTGRRGYTEEDKKLMREGQILQRLINNPEDYQNVISQFNELGANYSVPYITRSTGITANVPFAPSHKTTYIGRLEQMIGQANANINADDNLSRLGLTETGIGTIEYPLNASSLKQTLGKIKEGGVEIYGLNRLNIDKEGNITPSTTKLKLSNLTSKTSGKNFVSGALYNVPDADAFILYMADDKNNIYNFWVPGSQVDPNYEQNFNVAYDERGNKIKFSKLAKQYAECNKYYERAKLQYSANPTRENAEILEQAAQLASMAYDTYMGNIQNRGEKLLNTRIYRTAGTYNVNTAKPRAAFENNLLDYDYDYTDYIEEFEEE